MMLHAGVLNVVLQSGLQLSDFLLSIRIAVIPFSFVRHADVLQTVVWRNLLVMRGKTHTGRLGGGHFDGWNMVIWMSRDSVSQMRAVEAQQHWS